MNEHPSPDDDVAVPATQAAYTRADVDTYLLAVAERREELTAQIRAAEASAARAELAARRIEALERSVGELIVGAVARLGVTATAGQPERERSHAIPSAGE